MEELREIDEDGAEIEDIDEEKEEDDDEEEEEEEGREGRASACCKFAADTHKLGSSSSDGNMKSKIRNSA